MRVVMITTVDNPYDPIDQFEEWWDWDEAQGYGTCSLMARLLQTTDLDSESQVDEEVERSIDRILELFGESLYKKVVKEVD